MPLPTILFGFLVASLIGVMFHLWKGGGIGKIILYVILSWIGFWGGHFVGNALGWNFGNVGALKLGVAILGNALILGIGYWLSLVKVEPK